MLICLKYIVVPYFVRKAYEICGPVLHGAGFFSGLYLEFARSCLVCTWNLPDHAWLVYRIGHE